MAVREFQALKKVKEARRQQNIINREVITAANKQKKEAKKLERAKITAKRRSVKAAEI